MLGSVAGRLWWEMWLSKDFLWREWLCREWDGESGL